MKKLTLSDYIKRANEIHQNKYDYSKTIYINSSTKIIVICSTHGEFSQRPDMHLKGQGCPCCADNVKLTNKTFIEKAQKIHGDKYSYHKVEYSSNKSLIWIHCQEIDNSGLVHGDFQQRADIHLFGQGCPKCGVESIKSDTSKFIEASKLIHGDKFDYSMVNYEHSKEPITIICPIHGEFEQIPNGHLNGNGCQKCSLQGTSNQEQEIIQFIKSILPKDIEIIENSRNIFISNKTELDIYIPQYKLAIEFNGLYWHSEINQSNKNYHLDKTILCENSDIQLIHIFEDEWLTKKDIVKSRLINLLEQNKTKIYARQCIIKSVESNIANNFLKTNHIQGFVASKLYYGLYYNDELVSLMSFGGLRINLGQISTEGEFELLRFCNKLNISVIGGASKLFKHFLKINNPTRVVSYADRRWSIGKLYKTLGFNFKVNSIPNYFYVIKQQRLNRFNFRKDVLISKYGCLESDTEHNFCFNQGWYRIYDCGAKVYEYIPKNN